MVKAFFHGKMHYLPGDEEIGAEAHPLDDVQLFLNAAIGIFVGRTISVGHAVKGQLAQQFVVVIDIARVGALVFHTRVHADFTLLQEPFRILNELRIERKGRFQSFGRQENLVGSSTGRRLQARNQHVFVDGSHTLVQLKIAFLRKSYRLHGNEFVERLASK